VCVCVCVRPWVPNGPTLGDGDMAIMTALHAD